MNMKKKMKRFAKILVASLVVAGFCPTGIPTPINSVVEVQAATKAKVPTCAAKQTVRVVGAFGDLTEMVEQKLFWIFRNAISSLET